MSTLDKFVELLKEEILKDRKRSNPNIKWLGRDSWRGDTFNGFYTAYHVDLDELEKDIDAFTEKFKNETS